VRQLLGATECGTTKSMQHDNLINPESLTTLSLALTLLQYQIQDDVFLERKRTTPNAIDYPSLYR